MLAKNNLKNFTKPKRVVLLGGSGFIGQSLADHLGQEKINYVSISSKEINLLDENSIEKLAGVIQGDDSLVFLSALTPDKGKDAATTLKNLVMAHNLAKFLEKSVLNHLILIGSDAIYEDDIRPVPVNECTPTAPTSLYGLSHLGRELIISLAAKTSKIKYLALRPSAVFGRGDTHNSYGPNRFLRTAQESKKIALFGNGEEKRDHIWIKDLSRLIAFCLGHLTQGVLNATTGESTAFMQIARDIREFKGDDIAIECAPRSGPITHRHYDVSLRMKLFPNFKHTPFLEALSQIEAQSIS